jgi:hypothetical protein
MYIVHCNRCHNSVASQVCSIHMYVYVYLKALTIYGSSVIDKGVMTA